MCMCKSVNGKGTINGEPGYCWDDPSDVSVRQPDPPSLQEGDELIYDLPGRCGRGIDSHCQHFRLVKRYCSYAILVRNGLGDHRIELGSRPGVQVFEKMDHDDIYWFCQMLYHVQDARVHEARNKETARWQEAAIQKRIKVRKRKGRVEVTIMSAAEVLAKAGG